jgi:predicted patatin/cPLA2 family phospholipase
VIELNLVLEGGGMRGMFTAGVLDALDEQNLIFDYVIGVSAGACMGVSYVTRQRAAAGTSIFPIAGITVISVTAIF